MLLWLCMLCLIPFNLSSMDSTLLPSPAPAPAPAPQETQCGLVQGIIRVCKEHLVEAGPTREAACACLSALLTRPDMETAILSDFMSWACAHLEGWGGKGGAAEHELTRESFRLIGILHTISQIFKKGHRSNVLPFASRALRPCLVLTQQANQTLVRKLLIKVVALWLCGHRE